MIKVPFMKMPKSCNECAFSRLRFHLPNGKIGEGDEGKDGYNCQVEYWEKGRYETTRKAPCDELVIPEHCPLIEANKGEREEYEAKAITRGNCMICGKELTEGLFFCKECENKENSRKRGEETDEA